MKFDEYDQNKLQFAKSLLLEVLNYNFGDPRMRRELKRLETIIAKLETLQNIE